MDPTIDALRKKLDPSRTPGMGKATALILSWLLDLDLPGDQSGNVESLPDGYLRVTREPEGDSLRVSRRELKDTLFALGEDRSLTDREMDAFARIVDRL